MGLLSGVLFKTQVTKGETGQAAENLGSTERNEITKSAGLEDSVTKSSYANNSSSGSQFNNGEGNQNNVVGGTLIAGSTFTGEVHFGVNHEEYQNEIPQKRRVWLLGNDIADERYETSIGRRLDNTCDWIFTRSEFINWRSQPSSSPKWLWIHGPPGFGKTVLCARIIERIKTNPQEVVAYYFFSSDLESRKDPMTAVRSWVYHMAFTNKSVANIVNKAWNLGVGASRTVIIDLFREATKLIPDCTLVVDGLDECASASSCSVVTEFIREISKAIHGTNARILVMSRSESYIRRASKEDKSVKFFEYQVCEKDVCSDLLTMSKKIVAEKLSDKGTAIQDEMARKMSDRSKGQFLWLRFQRDALGEGLSKSQLRDAMEKTPAEISSLYARNWAYIRGLPENDRDRAISLLRLAAFSLRPLTVREISEAVLVSDMHEDFPVCELPDQWDEIYVKARILDLCCSFLETRSESPETPVEEWTVHLTHFSVKEFFLSHIPYQDSVQQNSRPNIATEHSVLAKLCITYMSYSYAWQGSTSDETLRLNSFTNYAANFWNEHVTDEMAQETQLMENFFDEANSSWIRWRKWFDSTNDGWANANSNPAIPLCYAIELGFFSLAMIIIRKGKVLVNCDRSSRTALGVACMKRSEDLTRELLMCGAQVGIMDAQGRTAIHYAAFNGDLKLVNVLIEHGADITIRDCDGVSPFLAASTNGSVSIMRRLIQKGADIHEMDKNGIGALFRASSKGHIKAARLLIGKGVLRHPLSYPTIPPVFAALDKGFLHLARLLIGEERDLDAMHTTSQQTILHFASSRGNLDIVKLLVSLRASHSLQDNWGQTPLFLASCNGHIEIVRFLLQHGAASTIATYKRQTPLLTACCNGHFDVAKLLLEFGADHSIADQVCGETPLYAACCNGHSDIVELLLEHGANDAVTTTEARKTPLFAACCNGHVGIVRLLIKNKATLVAPDATGKTPLYAACVNRHLEVASLLIDNGADIETSDTMGNTAFSVATVRGFFEIVQMLFQKGPGGSTTHFDRYAILEASERGYTELVQLLIKWNGEGIIEPNLLGSSLIKASRNGHAGVVALLLDAHSRQPGPDCEQSLYEACLNGHIEVVKLLIERGVGVHVTATEERGQTPLVAASVNGHLDVVKLLIQNGADIDAQNSAGFSAAYAAAEYGRLEVLRLLLSRGADICRKSKTGWLPIHIASVNGHGETVDFLIENGSDVMVPNVDDNTPLVLASINRHVDVVNVLLEHGVDIDAKDPYEQTSLLIASCEGDVELAKSLIDNCANVLIPDNKRRTPLYCASGNGYLNIVELLLDNEAYTIPKQHRKTPGYIAPINLPDFSGRTPLFVACAAGYKQVVNLLLKHGADLGIRDQYGNTPADAASQKNYIEICNLLHTYHQQINEDRGVSALPDTVEERQLQVRSAGMPNREFVGGNGVCQCNACQCGGRQL